MNSRLSDLWYNVNFCAMYLGYTLLFSYRSEGSNRIPPTGPVLLLANHESFLDPVAVGIVVRRRIWYLARQTLFKPAWFGRYLQSVGCLAIDQEGIGREGLRASVDALQDGKALLVFPEGERTWTGQMQPFKPGIALILRKAPVPIIPIGVSGAFEAYPRKAKFPRFSPLWWPWTGGAVAASAGEPIMPAQYQGMGREELLTFLFDAVQAQVRQADKLVRKPC